MDQTIIDNWNRVVGDDDRVYVLGDCVINRRFLYKLGHLRGKKTLVRGNHDIFETSEYLEHFDEVHGVLVYDKIVATHIPIHVDSLARFKGNVHGHLHAYVVERTTGQGKRVVDTRYVNVAVEQVNYTPLHHDELLKRFKDQP
jgi:calcineurin-like phosphoesterase family protein